MTGRQRVVCLSLGHLGGLDAGLGEFARQLCERVAGSAGSLRERGIGLCFHMQKRLHGAFGMEVGYLPYRPAQQMLSWRSGDCVLWHSLFQHNATRPPAQTPFRLLTVHDLNFRYARNMGSWRDSLLTRVAVSRSTHLATISRFVGDDVRQSLGWRGPLRTIYNGASDLRSVRLEPVPGLENRAFFFHVSRMAPSKNVRAIVELARAWPERHFVLAGPDWGDSQRLKRELDGSLPNLQFMLGISEGTKAWLLQSCEAFLFPSLAEGFGLPPIEAMNFGTPVFLSDRTSLPEIGGRFAAYFQDFSSQAMRSVIERELPRLKALGEKIRSHAEQFSWSRCADHYLEWYAELLSFDATGLVRDRP